MSYFIFDMDETLAEVFPLYYFIATLRLQDTINNPEIVIPNSLKYTLNKAYRYFVLRILKEEISERPLGVLRPGILDIMVRLSEMQKLKKIKNVIIYSNNGHLQSLEFIRDLIHIYTANDKLIRECIHWDHPMRTNEITSINTKTWSVLKRIMIEGSCKASPTIEPSSIYFFDDLEHPDLKEHLGENYYKVPAYDFNASFERVANIYKSALQYGKTNISLLEDYVGEYFINSPKLNGSLNGILDAFKEKVTDTANENILPPLDEDEGINMMLEAIKKADMKGGVRKRIKIKISTKKRKGLITRSLSRGKKLNKHIDK